MDKIVELLGKLLGLLGKIIEGIFSSKTFWLIVVAVAIFSLALRLPTIASVLPVDEQWKQFAALASIALILAKVIIWVVGLVLDQFA